MWVDESEAVTPIIWLYQTVDARKEELFFTDLLITLRSHGEFIGPGEFPAQRPVKRSYDVYFDLRLNKRLSKQPRGWWLETQSRPLWRQYNVQPCRVHPTKYALASPIVLLCQDDVMSWKRFLQYWPFVRGIYLLPIDSPHNGPVLRIFDVSFVVSMERLLKQESSCRWFERPCDATVPYIVAVSIFFRIT